ncbi:MAG: hypothetical protein D6737_09145 [Chloroflexi bacterium]|nr:MAG: hypothetical protein D6737_09145 [Chloroflexota bacterium]
MEICGNWLRAFDRKFVAVALAHDSRPTLVNATDTDWHAVHEQLQQLKIAIIELCPDYLAERLKN